jgi:Queuosine biosynthesis protein QueC
MFCADKEKTALVLFSGGQDSTTCLAWALDRFEHVETIGFDYGQRHRIELEVRPRVLDAMRRKFPAWRDRLVDDHLIDLAVLGALSNTSLTKGVEIAMWPTGYRTRLCPVGTYCFWPSLLRSRTEGKRNTWLSGSAKQTIPVIPPVAMTRSKRCSWPSILACRLGSSSIRRSCGSTRQRPGVSLNDWEATIWSISSATRPTLAITAIASIGIHGASDAGHAPRATYAPKAIKAIRWNRQCCRCD